MTTPNNTVAGLAEKWRKEADDAEESAREAQSIGLSDAAKACGKWAQLSREHANELEAALASPAPSAGVGVEAMDALRWYAEQAALCRKLGREGDTGRQALDADGGKRALAAIAALQHPAAPSVSPAYDPELIAQFLEATLRGEQHRFQFTAMSEQARLLREADNADAASIRTVNRSPSVAGGAGELPKLPYPGLYARFVGYYTADQMRAYGEQCRRLATAEQPGSAVQGEANADRWVAIKPEGAPYWGIHTEAGATIAGTSSGLSEGDAKRVVALHNNELCEADDLLRELGLDPARFRSEGGWLNAGKIRAALLYPQDYADLYTTPPPAPAAEQGDTIIIDGRIYTLDTVRTALLGLARDVAEQDGTQPEARGVEGK